MISISFDIQKGSGLPSEVHGEMPNDLMTKINKRKRKKDKSDLSASSSAKKKKRKVPSEKIEN